MATMVKFATRDVDKFDHLDLGVTRQWRALDLEALSAEQVEALRTYSKVPTYIVMVHPEDAERFAAYGAPEAMPAADEPAPEPELASESEPEPDPAPARRRR